MSILSNSRFCKINIQNVDFVKSTFDKIDITYIYLNILCPELIEETRIPSGLIFCAKGYFGLARTSLSLGRKFTHHGVMT